MIALIIILAILLVIAFLFFSPFKIYIDYKNGDLKVNFKYLFYHKSLNKQSKKNNKSPSKKNNSDLTDKKEKKKRLNFIPNDTKGKIEFVINIIKSSGKPMKAAIRKIKICDIFIDFFISNYDACECALKFGKTNIAVYNTLSYLACFMKLKKKSINIKCIYNQPECIYNFSFNVKFTPAAGIRALIVFIFTLLGNNIKSRKAKAVKNEKSENKYAANM